MIRENSEMYGGVLFVRTYGAEGDENQFFESLRRAQPDLLIIDDKCLCRPDCEGTSAVSAADVTLFSTGRAKHVDMGFGGFAYLKENVPYERSSREYSETALLRMTDHYKAAVAERTRFSLKSPEENWLDLSPPRLPLASYFQQTLNELSRADQHKLRINAIYEPNLPAVAQLPTRFQHWRFNLRLPDAEGLLSRLADAGLFASRHYPSASGVFSEGRFPVAERLHRQVVNLFNDKNYDEDKALRSTRIILRHLKELGQGKQ
jgi:hypothetical protein